MKFVRMKYKDLFCPDCNCVQRHSISEEGGLEICTCIYCGNEQSTKHITKHGSGSLKEDKRKGEKWTGSI